MQSQRCRHGRHFADGKLLGPANARGLSRLRRRRGSGPAAGRRARLRAPGGATPGPGSGSRAGRARPPKARERKAPLPTVARCASAPAAAGKRASALGARGLYVATRIYLKQASSKLESDICLLPVGTCPRRSPLGIDDSLHTAACLDGQSTHRCTLRLVLEGRGAIRVSPEHGAIVRVKLGFRRPGCSTHAQLNIRTANHNWLRWAGCAHQVSKLIPIDDSSLRVFPSVMPTVSHESNSASAFTAW